VISVFNVHHLVTYRLTQRITAY